MGVKIIDPERSRVNARISTLQLGLNSPSTPHVPYFVRSPLHFTCYSGGCKIPEDRVVERL